METFVCVVPLFSAWGFSQIREKTCPEFFQASPDVGCHSYLFKIGALAVVPRFPAWGFGQIREKTWPEFFQASPDGRWVVMVTYVVPRFAAWGFGRFWKKTWSQSSESRDSLTSQSKMAAKRRFWKKTWPEFFQASPDVRLVVMVTDS
jgi:hypothetical protein